jgi:hypothetical protein
MYLTTIFDEAGGFINLYNAINKQGRLVKTHLVLIDAIYGLLQLLFCIHLVFPSFVLVI